MANLLVITFDNMEEAGQPIWAISKLLQKNVADSDQ